MIFTKKDLESNLGQQNISAGEQIIAHGQIDHLNIQNGGQRITAVVNEATFAAERVFIRIRQQNGELLLEGECSCNQKKNCKHVAAVLLQSIAGDLHNNTDSKKQRAPVPPIAATKKVNPSTRQTVLYKLHRCKEFKYHVRIQMVVAECTGINNDSNNNNYTNYGKQVDYNPGHVLPRNPPRFLQAIDIEILTLLAGLPCPLSNHTQSKWPLMTATKNDHGEPGLMKKLLQSRRCFYQQPNQPLALHWGITRDLDLSWELDNQATQQLQWHVAAGTYALVLISSSPWYIETHSGECGPLHSKFPEAHMNRLLALDPVPFDEITQTTDSLNRQFSDGNFPHLQSPEIHHLATSHAIPHLKFVANDAPDLPRRQQNCDYTVLHFKYDGVQVSRDDSALTLDGQRYIKISRDHHFENSCHTLLLDLGCIFLKELSEKTGKDCYGFNSKWEWIKFQGESLDTLQEQSWCIHYGDGFRYRLAQPHQWFCETAKTEQHDWFSMSLGVEIDGKQIDLLSALIALFRKHPRGLRLNQNDLQPIILTLEDGRLLPISTQRLYPIYKTLLELSASVGFDPKDLHRIQHFQLARVTALLEPQNDTEWHWLAPEDIKQLAQHLRDVNTIAEVKPPDGLKATLRPYQQKGLNWLQFLRNNGFSGVLADDMGLGKTVQALAHLLLEKQQGRADKPSLVVAPTSLMFNWRRETHRFCPTLKILVLHGQHRHKDFENIQQHDLILTTYPLLVRDEPHLLSHDYHLVILDEAQTIKNPKAQVSQIARKLNARHRLCLTGTPMENHLGEIWSLFDFLMPGFLGTIGQFQRIYRNPIEKDADQKITARLVSRLKPFMLRRGKEDVAQDLPKKTEIVLEVNLDGEQRELYETVRLSMHRKIRDEIKSLGIARSQIVILDALLKLRQVCCDPRLVKSEHAQSVKESAKLELLEELLPELIEEGRRILIFSQFTSMLDLIESSIERAHIPYTKLTGSTRDREIPVNAFQSGEVPVFLISLKAGGVGLNLTSADTVIHYDPWWNPAVERQATDRAHRIGQKNPVFVYKLICEGTVEENIQTLQQQKQALADTLYKNNGNINTQWTEQDIMQLFQPITTTGT